MTSLDSFPLFPKLIPELRIHIWYHALLIPRLVFIWKHESRGSDYLRRSCASPLLSVNIESRCEALRYYSSPITGPCILPPPPHALRFQHSSHHSPKRIQYQQHQRQEEDLQSSTRPHYVGPGTDIIYISGSDPVLRRYKPVSWTCIALSRDVESTKPTLAPIRRLAVDEFFLRSTPFFQFARMPYSIWKLVVSDLRTLEELYVVKSDAVTGSGISDGSGSGGRREREWGKKEVEAKLREAKEEFRDYMECVWGDEVDKEEIAGWSLPEVKEVTFEELVAMSWTSWQ